jgi:hypothetical protein
VPVPPSRLSAAASSPGRSSAFSPTLDMEMTSPMPVDFEPPRANPRPAQQDLSLNSDFLDLPELPTGPGKLGPGDKS